MKMTKYCWKNHHKVNIEWKFCPECGIPLQSTKTPSPPKQELDIKFLYDLYSFAWCNHQVAANTLYECMRNIQDFYPPKSKNPLFEIEDFRVQKVYIAKIYAEYIALIEAFGVLALSLYHRKDQSILWTYLNTEPNEVSQFYDRILSLKRDSSLAKVLKFPQESEVKRAVATGVIKEIKGIPLITKPIAYEDIMLDYKHGMESIFDTASMYHNGGEINVRIYNKIKHVFSVVEGYHWLTESLGNDEIGIILDDTGQVGRLQVKQEWMDTIMDNIDTITNFGSELIALYSHLLQLNLV